MQLSEVIRLRRAVRAYTGQKVDEKTIRALLDAAIQAPSAMNAQPWVFAVVQDRATLQRYSDASKKLLLEGPMGDPKAGRYAELLRSETFDIFYDAGTLIAIGVEQRGPFTDADSWLAAENLMLTACDLGLGTCCIGFAVPLLNTDSVKRELGIPASGAVVAPIIVGHPSVKVPPVPRREPRISSWLE